MSPFFNTATPRTSKHYRPRLLSRPPAQAASPFSSSRVTLYDPLAPSFSRRFACSRDSPLSRPLVFSSLRAHSFDVRHSLADLHLSSSSICAVSHASSSPRTRKLRMTATPNHALQRTAPRVTLAAADHPAACAHPAPAAFPQPARRAPQSLSLGSFGDLAHALSCPNDRGSHPARRLAREHGV